MFWVLLVGAAAVIYLFIWIAFALQWLEYGVMTDLHFSSLQATNLLDKKIKIWFPLNKPNPKGPPNSE